MQGCPTLIKGKPMTVDLSKAQAGDKVKFRCGGDAVIESIGLYNASRKDYNVTLSGFDGHILYGVDGSYGFAEHKFIADIIAVEPKAFNWADAKVGMGFRKYPHNDIYTFLTFHPFNKDIGIFEDFTTHEAVTWFVFNMTRAPEHDVKIPD